MHLTSQAQSTVSRISTSLHSGDASPSMAHLLEIIRDLSSNANKLNIQDLADALSKDVAIASKVIIASNTIYFNHSGAKISTLTEAVNAIGLHEVRRLAVALLLMAPLTDESQQMEVREVSAVALTSGLIAQFLNVQLGGKNAEQAFICASLRHYGRMLLTNFMIDEYRYAHHLADKMSLDNAFRQVLGLVPLELGAETARSLNLAPILILCMTETPTSLLNHPPENDESQIVLLSDFAMQLCHLLENILPGTPEFDTEISNLAARFAPSLKTDPKTIHQLLKAALLELKKLEKTYNLRPFIGTFIDRLKNSSKRPATSPIFIAPITSEPLLPPTATADLLFAKGMEDLSDILSSDNISLASVYRIVVRTIHLGLHMKNTLLLTQEENEPFLSVRDATGENAYSLKLLFKINPAANDIFGLALHKGEDTLLEDLKDPKIQDFLPSWLRDTGTCRTALLLPLKDKHKVIGLIYTERHDPKSLSLTPEIHRHLKSIRNQIQIARQLLAA